MGIGMALQAVGEGIPVFKSVTPGALGHDGLVIFLCRNVGMKLGMALETVKTVLAVTGLKPLVLTTVT